MPGTVDPGSVDAGSIVVLARAARCTAMRRGRRRSAGVSAAIIGCWAVGVAAVGQWGRVVDNIAAGVTMVAGSFVAGSTPQGGGAVAFPVLTKVLGVSAADARTFSLCIQALGMGAASIAILLTRRPVDTRALRRTVPAAIAGYLVGTAALSVVTPPSAHVKIVFTLIVAAAGATTVLSRRPEIIRHLPAVSFDGRRTGRWIVSVSIVSVSVVGGLTSAIVGSGADVAVYLLLTIVLGLRPSTGVATSVVTMASVSIVGLATSITSGALTVAVPSTGADVFGMWLAAVPVVVVGAPVGSWFATRVSGAALARFIGGLAALEVVSTIVFLDELRTDPAVTAFALAGSVGTSAAVMCAMRVRDRLASAACDVSASVRRLDIELAVAR
ncbi:MAG: sulfite exporter TauE/SafE family protein [Actinomycetota bacterium]